MSTNTNYLLRIWIWRNGDLMLDRAADSLEKGRADIDRITCDIYAGLHGVGSFAIEIHAFDAFGIRLRRVESFAPIRLPARKTA
jgi:hypothetical protein